MKELKGALKGARKDDREESRHVEPFQVERPLQKIIHVKSKRMACASTQKVALGQENCAV